METKHNIPKLTGCSESSDHGEFIAVNNCIKKEWSQTNTLDLHLKELEGEGQTKLQTSRMKDVIEMRTELNETENRKTIVRINKTKSWFFEKIDRIDKPLAKLINQKWDKMRHFSYICIYVYDILDL